MSFFPWNVPDHERLLWIAFYEMVERFPIFNRGISSKKGQPPKPVENIGIPAHNDHIVHLFCPICVLSAACRERIAPGLKVTFIP